VFFHVRDLAPAKELVAGMHAESKRSNRRGKRGSRTSSPDAWLHSSHSASPVFMPDDKHLIVAAPSRAAANGARRALERALGEGIEHVETRRVKAPGAAGAASTRRRS
jgi:hypothetical protein